MNSETDDTITTSLVSTFYPNTCNKKTNQIHLLTTSKTGPVFQPQTISYHRRCAAAVHSKLSRHYYPFYERQKLIKI